MHHTSTPETKLLYVGSAPNKTFHVASINSNPTPAINLLFVGSTHQHKVPCSSKRFITVSIYLSIHTQTSSIQNGFLLLLIYVWVCLWVVDSSHVQQLSLAYSRYLAHSLPTNTQEQRPLFPCKLNLLLFTIPAMEGRSSGECLESPGPLFAKS